jgi:hypothetical protein
LTGLDRLEEWLRLEMERPEWKAVLPAAEALRALVTDDATPSNLKTRAEGLLKALFPRAVLDSWFDRILPDGSQVSDPEAVRVFSAAGPLALEFFQEKIMAAEPKALEGREGMKLAALADGLEKAEVRSLDKVLDRAKGDRGIRILLALAGHWPLPAYLADPVRDRLAQFPPDVRKKALGLVEKTQRKDLHGLAVEMLNDADLEIVEQALRILSTLKIAGVSRHVVSMLEARDFPGRDQKEFFWSDACRHLAAMGDSMAIKPLMEWAQSFSLLEKRKEKPLGIRRAALQALGQFRSSQVKIFLERMINEGDPELADVLSESHEKVCALLSQPSASAESELS